MHWIAWSKLCKSKSQGGLGFRTINEFNTALLAKQLWRLMEYPDSLFAKVMKGRYFRDSSPMTDKKIYSPSYGWRSIMSAKSLIKKGLIMRVGSGQSISVWNDPWIPAEKPRPARSNGHILYPALTVDQLVIQSSKIWNLELISNIIDTEDIPLIWGIQISQSYKKDKVGWHYTKSGKYTVKSGYAIEEEELWKKTTLENYGPEIHSLQAHAWKLKCPKKLQHFIWQALTGCLAVMENLNYRGIKCDRVCSRCGAEKETINHALFECPPSKQTWALSNIPSPLDIFPTQSIYANLDYLYWRINREETGVKDFPWIIWYIWKARNDKIFNNIDRDPIELLKLANVESTVWEEAQIVSEEEHPIVVQTGDWSLSDAEFRVYIDGSWKKTDIFTGQGWFCTHNNMDGCLMGARNVRRSLTPLHAEVEAFIWAMSCMLAHDRRSVAFATDCSDLIAMTTNPMEWPAFSVHLEEIIKLKHTFTTFSLSHIPRSHNVKADNLANSARKYPFIVEYVNMLPPVWISEPF